MKQPIIITLDGPAASGKSTLARMLAQCLKIDYLNTGMLFRALAYLLLQQGYTVEQLSNPLPEDLDALFKQEAFRYQYSQGTVTIIIDGNDVAPLLKDAMIDQGASIIATNEMVRAFVLQYERAYALQHDTVVEGRDCGSVVFPQATIKFFITASMQVRAHRLMVDQKKRGIMMTEQEAIAALQERDKRDSERAYAPLVIPDDALIIDNSHLNPQETLEEILQHMHKRKIIPFVHHGS